MKNRAYSQIKSNLKFRFKVVIKKSIMHIFSMIGFKISFNSTNELIISRNIEETLSKIAIANTVSGVEKSDNLNFKKFILNNLEYLSEGLPVLWILFLFNCKRDGYFVEFGACDGLLFSNTNLLEKNFGWTGILAEPNKSYFNRIVENRNVIIDTRAVWSKTGELVEFAEVSAGGLSGIYSSFRENNNSFNKRESLGLKKYPVKTISLNDLLDEHNAPLDFDLLCIDTEGSEFEIIENFDLIKYRPKVICIEFDGTQYDTKNFENILLAYGYKSVGDELKDERNLWFVSNKLSV